MTAAAARSRSSTPGSGPSRRSSAARADQPRLRASSSPANVVRPHLRVLDQQALRRRARRRNVAMVMFVVLIIGFFAAALAQAQLVANQHELDVLRTRIAETEAERARLERSVEESSAPAAIIERATGTLGMVRANDPVYLAAVGPAPQVAPVSIVGAITASTDAVDPADGPVATETIAAASAGRAPSSGGEDGSDIEQQFAAPILAGLAGTRAVATGIGTG